MAGRRSVKRVIKWMLLPVLLFGLYVVGVLIYGTMTDWQPKSILTVNSDTEEGSLPGDTVSIISWNIGFGGLGKETSFFYDGGDTVIQEDSLVKKNMEGIASTLAGFEDSDIILLQEVDSCSKRSHFRNEIDFLKQNLPGYAAAFCMNYNVDFVPMPITEPMGEVRSGLLTLSKPASHNHERHGFDTEFEWPRRVFFLDRCFLKQHIDLDQGRELVVLNTHCSAYDTSGDLVKKEIDTMLAFAQSEYEKGNYVVIGGDWNQCPPNYTPIDPGGPYNEFVLSDEQIPDGWSWVADPSTPTNRKLDKVYDFATSYTSVIDHFLVSPNVSVVKVETHDTKFEFSDHQPVELQIALD
jgi:endonuclease/exonuclease/phosphatase family metal-dependent hydrolase